MKFHEVKPETWPDNWNLYLWESENGRWQVRVDRVLYGARVHVGLAAGLTFITDYCAGNNPAWILALFHVVRLIVQQYPESIDFYELEGIGWPLQRCKPMFNDPDCWRQLCAMVHVMTDDDRRFFE